MSIQLHKIFIFKEIIFTLKNWKVLGKIILIPLLLVWIMQWMKTPIIAVNKNGGLNVSYDLFNIILFILTSFFTVVWIPQWIQYVANPKAQVWWLHVDKTTVKFFLYNIAINFGLMLIFSGLIAGCFFAFYKGVHFFGIGKPITSFFSIGALLSTIFIGIPLAIIMGFGAYCKLQFIFPAIALKHKTGLSTSWKQTKGLVWRIMTINLKSFLLCALFLFLITIFYALIFLILYAYVDFFKAFLVGDILFMMKQVLLCIGSIGIFFIVTVIMGATTRLYQHVVKNPTLN